MNKQELITEIELFLNNHGKKDQGLNPEVIWSSPDANEIDRVKNQLMTEDSIIQLPNSSWESGGYTPYSDLKAKAWHNEILRKIKVFNKSSDK